MNRLLCQIFIALYALHAMAGDQPQWGQAWSRNMVSAEKRLPAIFDPNKGLNVRWSAQLGNESYSTPIVANGRVYIGTNNREPRDPMHASDAGVLMCFDERSGQFLWQLVVPKREEDPYHDWPNTGMPGPVTVEGNRIYLVSNRGEVMCLDAKGMADGNQGPYIDEAVHMLPRSTNSISVGVPHSGPRDADIVWLFDLTSGAGIWSHDGAHSSILVHGEYLYLNSGTGVDNTHKQIQTPDAPSLVVFDKRDGRLIARDDEHIAPDIFHCTWSSPSMGTIGRKPWLFFGGGNGVLYAFDVIESHGYSEAKIHESQLLKLNKVWQFDFDPAAPKENIHQFLSNRREGPSNFYGMPVFAYNRVYLAGGGDLWWGKNQAWLKCIDPTKSTTSKDGGLVWSYPLERHVLSTPAVYKDMVFIADCGRKLHCVDARTGKPYWTHEVKGEVWASTLVADGKVYLGTRSGEFWVLAASKEKKVLNTIEFGSPISGTATAANHTLYVATMTHLYALKQP